MRKILLISVALVGLLASQAFALAPVRTETPNYVIYRFTSPDTVATATAEVWTFQIAPSVLPRVELDDDANAQSNIYSGMKLWIGNDTSTAGADSIGVGIWTSADSGGPWFNAVVVTNDTFCLDGGEAKVSTIVNGIGPWWKVHVKVLKGSSLTPVLYMAIPKIK